MSRTYRKHLDGEYIIQGEFYHWKDPRLDSIGFYGGGLVGMGFKYRIRIIKNQRDNKPWDKPPKWFKQMNRRSERSKEKQALREEKEIPFFRKSDQWDWT